VIGRRQSTDRQFNAVLFANSGRINLSCPNSSQEAKEMAATTKDFNASPWKAKMRHLPQSAKMWYYQSEYDTTFFDDNGMPAENKLFHTHPGW
jgi:hypothetical protein